MFHKLLTGLSLTGLGIIALKLIQLRYTLTVLAKFQVINDTATKDFLLKAMATLSDVANGDGRIMAELAELRAMVDSIHTDTGEIKRMLILLMNNS